MEEFIPLKDICQKETEFIKYRKLMSENKIHFFYPFEILKTLNEKTITETHYLKLKSIRNTYDTDEMYLPPVGIFASEELINNWLDALKNQQINITEKMLMDFCLCENPDFEGVRFRYSNEDGGIKDRVLEIERFRKYIRNRINTPNFDLETEIKQMIQKLKDSYAEYTKKVTTFKENDFDCQELTKSLAKDAHFKVASWCPNSIPVKISAKKLYIRNIDVISRDESSQVYDSDSLNTTKEPEKDALNKKHRHAIRANELVEVLKLFKDLFLDNQLGKYRHRNFIDVFDSPQKIFDLLVCAIQEPKKAAGLLNSPEYKLTVSLDLKKFQEKYPYQENEKKFSGWKNTFLKECVAKWIIEEKNIQS